MHYIFLFCVFTAIALAFRGIAAVRWRPGVVTSVRANLTMALANRVVFGPLIVIAVSAGQQALTVSGLPHVSPHVWAGTPLVLVALLYVLVHDFMDYWCHRLLHTRLGWPVHAVHHSDTDLNWTSSYRIHALEALLMKVFYLALAIATGLPPLGALAAFVMFSAYNAFVHMDADVHFGPLTKVFASPRFHQWHHADVPAAHNKNFANIFAFWDVLFGTYRVPGPCNVSFGFQGSPGHRVDQLIVFPFIAWGRMSRPGSDTV
jgi:sterol desaturase/sphingolipid hydroxylase (fatty acid hydroxylase superfamily)